MPGEIARTSAHSGELKSTSAGDSGRGPIRLISPRSTFQSCGNSSSFQCRSFAPRGVIRESSPAVIRAPASRRMDRNFTSPNSFPPRPTHVSMNSTGHPSRQRIASAHASNTGDSKTIRTPATMRSMRAFAALLAYRLIIYFSGVISAAR
jgi:hypothetical protein